MMKKTKSPWAGMLLLSALTILSLSCKREVDDVILPGDSVVFKASADYDNGPETKTSYSGVEYGGKERIDWVSGDKIRILSDKARHPGGASWSDYQVTGVTPGTGSNQPISYASIKNVGDNGLHWGSGTHNFYAVYPSPATNSDISINNNVINLALPKSQLQAAQMDYAYMFAAVQTAAKATVNLSFKPMFTAFQFQVRSDEEASMTITSFSLSTGENKAMTGSCRATITAGTNSAASTAVYSNFTAYNASSGNNTITVDMGAGITVTPSSYATITVFALPQDYSQLTASFTTSTGDTKSLKLQQADGTWVNFTACHKYNINGLGLPGGGWTYTASDIDDIIRTGEEVLYDYSKDVTVTVQRSRTGTTEGIPWKAYFTAASDPTAVVGASAVGQSWSETPMQDADGNDWLSLSAYSGNGNANNVTVSLAGNELPPSAIDLMTDAQAMTTAMSANNLGTIDLSRMKFNGSTFAYRSSNPANTANCYVINGYGTFYIPLVYGNAIKNGTAVPYFDVMGDDFSLIGSRYEYSTIPVKTSYEPQMPLCRHPNADAKVMSSCYILEDSNLQKSGLYEARIIWQDVAPGFEIIRDSDVSFVPAGSSELSGVAALSCDYLKFQVRQYQSQISGRGIKPGNAVIALYDKGEDKILWSWHLWFTNETFSTISSPYESSFFNLGADKDENHFLSCNLGWTPPISYDDSKTDVRTQKIVLVDTLSNLVRTSFVVRDDSFMLPSYQSMYYADCSYSVYRKDPIIAFNHMGQKRPHTSRYYKSLHFYPWWLDPRSPRNLGYEWGVRYPYRLTIPTTDFYPDGPSWRKHLSDPSPSGFVTPPVCSFNRNYLPKDFFPTFYDPENDQEITFTHTYNFLYYARVPSSGEYPPGILLPRDINDIPSPVLGQANALSLTNGIYFPVSYTFAYEHEESLTGSSILKFTGPRVSAWCLGYDYYMDYAGFVVFYDYPDYFDMYDLYRGDLTWPPHYALGLWDQTDGRPIQIRPVLENNP